MHKAHALIIALALGVAAVAGTFAALETTSVGAQAAGQSSSAAEIIPILRRAPTVGRA